MSHRPEFLSAEFFHYFNYAVMGKRRGLSLLCLLFVWAAVAARNDSLRIVRSLEIADSLYQVGRVDSALVICRNLVPTVRSLGQADVKVSFYTSQGVYLRSSGALQEAVGSYDEALSCLDSLDFSVEDELQSAVVLYNNLAALHLDMKSPEKAGEYALRAATLADKCSDKAFRSQIYAVASSVFISCKQNDRAKEYLMKAMELSHEVRQFDAELNALTYYLLIVDREGASSAQMEPYMARAEALLPQVSSVMSLINYYQVLYLMHSGHKNYRAAISTSQKLLGIEEVKNYPFLQYDVYNNLHEAYRNMGDYKNAYQTLRQAQMLNDSLFQKEKTRQLEELSVKYESKEKELEIQKLNEEKRQERQRLYMLVAVFAFVLVVLGLAIAYLLQRQILRAERQKRQSEALEHEFREQQRATEQKLTRDYLDKLEHEHARLAKELHDGICNDLFSIELAVRSADTSAESLVESLRQTREGIRRVSHELLPPVFQEATITEVIANYLDNLSTASCQIEFTTLPPEVDWTGLPQSMMLNVYRIVQEAVSNALKHAHASKISVALEWKLPDLEIRIQDNGTYAGSSRPGVGMQTMKERVAAMKGSFHMDVADGTKIVVRIPVF